jgi:hypothetical protein
MEVDLERDRARLAEMFEHGPLAMIPTAAQFREIVGGGLPTSDVFDLVAFNLIEDLSLKQSLLAEGDIRARIGRTLDALSALHPSVPADYFRLPTNPSVN